MACERKITECKMFLENYRTCGILTGQTPIIKRSLKTEKI